MRAGKRTALAVCAARGLTLAAAFAGAACTPPVPRTPDGAQVGTLAVERVEWDHAKGALGTVRAVADDGRVFAVLTDKGASIFSGGARVAEDATTTDWLRASVVPAIGSGVHWLVGIDARGRVSYLRDVSTFEDVSPRYGFSSGHVQGVASLGGGLTAFLVDGQLAVVDRTRVTRYPTKDLVEVAGGGEKAVTVAPDAVQVWNAKDKTVVAYRLPGVTHAALGLDGRVYASTTRAIYASTSEGNLSLVYVAGGPTIHGLVAAASHVWFAEGSALGMVDGAAVSKTSPALIGTDATLTASPSGDVWVLGSGGLLRFRLEAGVTEPASRWASTVAPVFSRACASCHTAGGISGIDLSTAIAWERNRDTIRDRVLVSGTMPPRGHGMTDADRNVVRQWATAIGNNP